VVPFSGKTNRGKSDEKPPFSEKAVRAGETMSRLSEASQMRVKTPVKTGIPGDRHFFYRRIWSKFTGGNTGKNEI
jgi:hypothetical protein